MWSGGADQWGMNHAMTYMSMPHEQVDWASLAQQWIKMKEEAPVKAEEGGEAPMEITKDEATPAAVAPRENEWMNPQAPGMASAPGDANNASWGAPGWNWDQAGNWMQWAGATGQTPNMAAAAGYTTMPNAAAGYTTVPNADVPVIPPVAPPAPMYPYTPTAVPPVPSPADSYTRGYWTGNPPASVALPPETVKPSRWDAGNSRKKHSSHNAHPVDLPVPELDAAKRRALPAWIREGLEKMEREKQKKAEQERVSSLKKSGSSESIVDDIAEETMTNGDEVPKKSRFDSDSESDDVPGDVKPPATTTPRRSRFDQSEPAVPSQPSKPKFKTKEQILQAVMGDVRRILTQLLMEVTTEEIQKAAEETQRLFKKKAPAATLRKTPALASLTGKLGLGIYESDSEDESEPEKVTNDPDSDQELQDRIKRLKKDFVRVEEHIEKEALELEERERNQLLAGQNRGADREPSPTVVEEQVQPIREGSTADDHEPNHRHKVEPKDPDPRDVRPADPESEDTRSSSAVEEVSEKAGKARRPEEKPKARPGGECGKKKQKSSSEESSKSDSSSYDSSSSSSSTDGEDEGSKRSRRRRKRREKKAPRRSRYSLSASPQPRKRPERSRSRDTRSRSQSRHSHRTRRDSRHSGRRPSRKYTPEREVRKRRRSSSASSDGARKYRKSSHRRR